MSQVPDILAEGRARIVALVGLAGIGQAAATGLAAFATRDLFAALHQAGPTALLSLAMLGGTGVAVALFRVFERIAAVCCPMLATSCAHRSPSSRARPTWLCVAQGRSPLNSTARRWCGLAKQRRTRPVWSMTSFSSHVTKRATPACKRRNLISPNWWWEPFGPSIPMLSLRSAPRRRCAGIPTGSPRR